MVSRNKWLYGIRLCALSPTAESPELTSTVDPTRLVDTFGSPGFHPDGSALVYTAEASPPASSTNPSSKNLPHSATFKYSADFGETFTGKRNPQVYLLLLQDSPYRLSHGDEIEIHRITSNEDFGETVFGTPAFLPSMLDEATAEVPRLVATGFTSAGDGRKMCVTFSPRFPSVFCCTSGDDTDTRP